jgi:hypothetical protein
VNAPQELVLLDNKLGRLSRGRFGERVGGLTEMRGAFKGEISRERRAMQ